MYEDISKCKLVCDLNSDVCIRKAPEIETVRNLSDGLAITINGQEYKLENYKEEIKKPEKKIPAIDRYIVNGNTVIVLFRDGSKTISTCDSEDNFEVETGIMMCILKKLCGDNVLTQVEKVVKIQTKYERLRNEIQEKLKRRKKEDEERKLKHKEELRQRKVLAQAKFELEVEKKKKEILKKKEL